MQFEEHREYVKDKPRRGPPSTSTTDKKVEEVKKMVLENCPITIRENAGKDGICGPVMGVGKIPTKIT